MEIRIRWYLDLILVMSECIQSEFIVGLAYNS